MTRRDLQLSGVETGAGPLLPEPPAALESLKSALTESRTPNQLSALIVDFTHEEILAAYHQLPFREQQYLQKLWTTET